jgi:hypothetical protein
VINPTKNDIGRKVVYRMSPIAIDEGVITSFNDAFVFVRYGANTTSAATKREHLEWTSGGDTAP